MTMKKSINPTTLISKVTFILGILLIILLIIIGIWQSTIDNLQVNIVDNQTVYITSFGQVHEYKINR